MIQPDKKGDKEGVFSPRLPNDVLKIKVKFFSFSFLKELKFTAARKKVAGSILEHTICPVPGIWYRLADVGEPMQQKKPAL